MKAGIQMQIPGGLVDNDLKLILTEKYPGDPSIGHVPAYKFKMTRVDQDEETGRIQLRVGDTYRILMYAIRSTKRGRSE